LITIDESFDIGQISKIWYSPYSRKNNIATVAGCLIITYVHILLFILLSFNMKKLWEYRNVFKLIYS